MLSTFNIIFICTMTLSCILLIVTGMIDPGIIPRNTDPLLETIPPQFREAIDKQDSRKRFFLKKRAISKQVIDITWYHSLKKSNVNIDDLAESDDPI
mmetsp:Transcript_40708/g.62131  ORF Transcript_40708/g.62131 Transcript_40708/m.62131 type:complete len:97 (+) Transcript_40708:681-971(+)